MVKTTPLPMNKIADRKLERDGILRRRAAYASLGVAALLILIKMGGYFTTESSSMLASLMDSMLDGLSALVTIIGIKQAQRPPNRSYRFGRGKAEPLAALTQAAFIVGSAILLCVEVTNRLFTTPTIRNETIGIWVLIISSVIVLVLTVFQNYVVKRTDSVAIKADLRHYVGDVGINVAAILGLILSLLTHEVFYDALFALIVAVFLIINSWGVAHQALRLLLDRELTGQERDSIKSLVLSHPQARGMHDLRTRNSGTKRFIELHLELEGQLTLLNAHDITDEIEQSLIQAFPNAEILIHQEPAGLKDERLDQRIAEAVQNEK